MFYSQFILAKKGPLGTIWIAAHLERKLRKNQVADTDIGFSVDSILFPEMPIALRLSSHLLLGVVRIYSRKVNYLFDDCSEALLKVKQAFRSTAVDLPPEESTAPYHSITLPETFDLDDFELPDHEIFQGNYVDRNISSKEQITLQDTMEGVVYSTSNFGLDERFGDGDACGLDLDEELMVEKGASVEEHATGTSYSDVDPQASDQVNALFKYDHNQDTPTIPEAMTPGTAMYQMDEYDGDNEPVDYAHAPCTPGLLEEPNLSNIQETSGYDDHQEPENHTLKENLQNDSIEQNHNQFQQFEPIEKSPPQIVTTEEISLEKLPPHIVTTDHMLTNNVVSVDQVRSIMSPIPEVHEDVVPVIDDPVKVLELNKNKEPEVHTFDNNHENYVQHQDMSNNYSHQENPFHVTNELELNSEPSFEHDLVSQSHQEQAFQQAKESTIPIQSNQENMQSFDFMGLRPCVTLSNHDAMKDAVSIPPSSFTSMQEHPTSYGVPNLLQGQIQHATEPLERNIPETFFPEVGPTSVVQVAPSMPNRQVDNMSDLVQVAPSIPNRQVDNVIEREVQDYNTQMASFLQGYSNVPESTPIVHQGAFSSSMSNRQVESVNERYVQVNNSNSYTSNYNAPEKIMSFSQGYSDVQKVPESTPVMGPPSYDTGNSNKYTGRKRSITESLMTSQSLNFNLNESSTFYTTNSNTSRESFRDDDLLSSILVGRNSSILKMKPTPMPTHQADMAPSTKRRRQSAPKTAPKSSVSKRKVLMDDSMVLHGDTIRQQLTNTEDIRRIRKKAPCTHSEISMIHKQFLEDDLFGQPIFTGMSSKLTSLQKQLYDITKITVSQYDNDASSERLPEKSISHNDEKEKEKEIVQPEMVKESRGVSIEQDIGKENKEEDNFDPIPIQDVSDVHKDNDNNFDLSGIKDVSEEQQPDVNQHNSDLSEEQPLVTDNDNHTYDNSRTDLDYYEDQPQIHTTGDFTHLFGPENDVLDQATAMEIDDNTFHPDSHNGAPVITESPVVPSETNDTSASLHETEKSQKTNQMDTCLLTAPPGFELPSGPPGFELPRGPPGFELPGFELAGPPGFQKLELKSSADVDINVNNKSLESEGVSEININGNEGDSVREVQEEIEEPVVKSSETDGKILDNIALDQERNEEVDFPVTVDHNADNHISNGVFSEEYEPVAGSSSYDELENALLDERKRPGHHHPMATLNLEDIPATVDFGDDENDIDFLNFDDEAGEADDDYNHDGEATKMLDNTGWSSRTRAVAKYLQIMFDKEGERGRNMLGVNNLLAGKTRKEASRMFFETLVLKTKDYIHVEQTDPFENINVFPRSKLLKSEF